jgi:tRNA-splicing ligase RtcB
MSGLRQIKPYLYEIPKTGRMRVPGRIFATRELLESQKADEAVEQVRNVAHLPGIVDYSLAMPDFHWGYGFPIGGVAAFDLDEGVLSPGGIGYDINCLSGDARVLHPLGYTRAIRDLVEGRSETPVRSLDLQRRAREIPANVTAGLADRPRRSVFELVTGSGRTVVATEDHPFLTPWGMRPLGELRTGDRVAVIPFEGVPYERPSPAVLLTERDLRRAAASVGKTDAGRGLVQALRALSPLLPLMTAHPALPPLLKLLGSVWGDGSLHFQKRGGRGVVSLTGRPGDLRALAVELKPWFRASRVYSRHRCHLIHTTYGARRTRSTEHFIRFRSTGLALLLRSLGLPAGPKASQTWELPSWLHRLPLWQQRLFLASFFGAELSSPKALEHANRNFGCPVLVVVKRDGHVESGERFLAGLSRMLERFGVSSLCVSRRPEQMNPDGRRSHRLRLILGGSDSNLLALWTRVGFECNAKRSRLAAEAAAYLLRKRAFLAVRDRLRRRILEIRAVTGWSAKKILGAVAGEAPPVNLRFVERTIYGRGEREIRASAGFPTFRAWRRSWVRQGLVWDEVLAKTPRADVDRVYDVSVDHRDHVFIADGFVVHNCGVRLIRTDLKKADVLPRIRDVVKDLFRAIPAGVGSDGAIPTPSREEGRALVVEGAKWAVDRGFGTKADLDHIEDGGLYPWADPGAVSDRAFARGLPQVGTLGSGNHFLEVQVVDEVYRKDVADHFGIEPGSICYSIHSGSRGFGYQICDESLKAMQQATRDYGIELPDRQLCCAPLSSPEAKRYLGAMACAANFAWVNRQVMMAIANRTLARTLGVGEDALGARLIYDVCHNIAKFEDHGGRRVCVHRKGATRAFRPGHPLLPAAYRELGQPTFIPGDMGRASFLLIGKPGAMSDTFGSTCHGAGRAHSRTEMKRRTAGRDLFRELEREHGVVVMGHGRDSVAEEMPEAYKDASLVVDVMEQAGVTDKVARLRPIGCIKG